MTGNQKVINFFVNNWKYLSYILLLIIGMAYFIMFQQAPTFPDPDSFYHAKMALLIPEKGVIKSFPWLQATDLKDSFIDQHFLYHVFLIPFVKMMDPLQGVKLANVFLSVGLTLIFYWLLRRYKIKLAFLFTLLLLVTTPFIFRINLIKAPVFSVIILLLALILMFRHKYLGIFILSFFYVWSYGGFILILVFTGAYALVSLIRDWWRYLSKETKGFFLFYNKELRLFIISLAGVLSGLIINPQFPQNLEFYWQQLVKIGIVNYQSIIPVGNEWYPYKFIDLTAGSALVTILLLITFFALAFNYKRITKKTATLFIIYLFFFIFTLKSRRYVEYYIPFAIIFCAFAINEVLPKLRWDRLWPKFFRLYNRHKMLISLLIIYFAVFIPALAIKDIKQTYNDYQNGISLNRFKESSLWLQSNSEEGAIVFHSSWDEFPILFYYNSHNYYIAGLDPTFTYEYNKEIYHKMVNITIGKQTENIYKDIKNVFQASYVFVEIKHEAMKNNIEKSNGFEKVYEDREAIIYQVI